MAKDPNRVISELHKGRYIPTQNIKRKKIATHLTDRKTTRPLKNSAITMPLLAKQMEEALRRSEEKYQTIIESIQEGYFEIDLAGNYTFVNDAECVILGYSRDELIGMNNRQYTDKEYAKNVFQAFNKLYKTGVPIKELDYEIIRKDGTKRFTDISASLIRNLEGEPIGFRGISRDITERKRIEGQLLNAAQQWRTTFDGISDIVCLLDREGRILKCNKAMTHLLGKPFSEIINRTHLEIVHGAPMPIEESPVERLWKTHHRETDILLINDRWFSIAVDPLLDEAGRLVGAVYIMSDITERKRAEEALRRSEERYRTIIENIQDGYFEVDLPGNFTFVNDAMCRIFGISKEEFLGSNYSQYTDQENAKKVFQAFNQVYKTGERGRILDYEIIQKDGAKRYVEASFSLARDSSGKPIGFRGVIRDITERKQAEDALRRSEEKYRTILESIQEGYFENDLAGNFTFVNDALCGHLGYTKEELVGMNYRQFQQDETTAQKTYQAFNEIYRTGEPLKVLESEYIRKDGTKRTYEQSTSLIRDSEGKPIGFRSVSRDITERKQADEALRQSEEKYRTILENMQEAYYEIDLAGHLTFFNDALCKHLGYPKEELIGRVYRQYQDETTAKKIYQLYNEVYRTGEPVRAAEAEYIRKDGTKGTYELSVSLLRDTQGKPIGFRGISRDVTKRKQAAEALRQSEEKYRTVLESIEEGYYEVDLVGNFTFFNDPMCRLLGYSKDELMGMNNRQYTDQENANRLFQAFNQVYRTREPGRGFDWEIIKKDGTQRIVEASFSLRKDSSGEPIGFRGIVRDITKRKRAEEALRQSEEKYRTILETIEDGYYEVGLAGNFTFLNDSMCRIWGYPKEELMGMNYQQYTDKESAKKVFEAYNRVYRTEEPGRLFDYEIMRKDGAKRYVEVSISLQKDPSGKPVGFSGIIRDVTERKLAEEALRLSEERYRNIIENIQDGYFENDLAGNFTFVNDVICRHLGYTKEELIGMNYQQYAHEENAKKMKNLYTELYRTGTPIEVKEYELTRKDGIKAIYEISASLIRDSEGKPIGFRGISRDVTERKQAEEEKLSLQEQLRQSQKMEAIGQLAGGVAHDFNNLLTVIKGYSQLSLLDLKEDNPLWGNIQEIEKATQRATDLTRQLLAFSRRQILDLRVLDLNVLLPDLDKMLRRIIGENIELVTLLSKDLGKVKIDPSQIEQVIFNLAVNARDAMPSGGKLTIETANVELDEEYAHAHVNVAPGRYVRLSVSDTGVGMSQEVKERVFEPFFTTKEKGKGTGLGLSMVYGIVKQSNGNIWLYSEPERGTTFRIYLPRTEEEADTLHEREETDFSPRGSETVLLVEDDELVRDLANRLLEQQGYRVLKAANGQEALRVAKEHVGETIHLLLADIVMPHMGGKELADWLKISRPNVKILYTSGYADNAIVHHGVLDPGTHFLQKPFSLKTLSHKVREVLDG